ncbi:MAG: lipopolysaccharide transport periplasmic protein LptA [Betaproteobacteria bacterium]|nr:lipopolysaccharide transport periplasmic protein LptA [Betaproteobacteria bacterium]
MTRSLLLSLLAVLSLIQPVLAEKADRFKPLHAESDAMRHDELKARTIFTGNVIMTKGTINLRAERVEVTQTPDGFQQANALAAPGKLVYWRSKRDGVDEYIEAEAEVADYDGKTDLLVLTRKAVLRRYVGTTLADETTGDLIRYDNTREVLTVDGEPRAAGGGTSRVRAMLSPRQKPGASPAPPAAPPAVMAPALRPSPTLSPQK